MFRRPTTPPSRRVTSWRPCAVTVLVAAGAAAGAPADTHAAPSPAFTPGASSLGDALFPTIGNGGYDARHYDLDLDYEVDSMRLQGTATVDAVATQDLSRFSFDLTDWNVVRRVTVDGRPATFRVDAARSKLTITPARGIRDRRRFRTVVHYGGIQRPFPGATKLREGWIPDPDAGAVVLAQPVGAMGWYPNNNVPSDKATYTTRITVPRGFSALATGVLAGRRDAGPAENPTSTFVWTEPSPTSTFLVSVSVGRFDVNSLDPARPAWTRPAAGSPNRPVPFYTAITSAMPDAGKVRSAENLGRSAEIVDFFSSYFGVRYPFTSLGGIVTLQSFYMGLETQGKPTYAIDPFDAGYGLGIDLVAHELAHQFFGNMVTPARWRDVWLSEGMAVFSEWVWSSVDDPYAPSPRDQYRDVYANETYPISWRVPPADPAGPQDLFDRDGMYRRGPATFEAIREILGDDATFKAMMRRWLTEHAYGSATTEDFVALVKRTDPARAARWTEFFRQWLYTSYPVPADGPGQSPVEKPQMHVDNFDTYALPGA
jgi:aminopeptidase N